MFEVNNKTVRKMSMTSFSSTVPVGIEDVFSVKSVNFFWNNFSTEHFRTTATEDLISGIANLVHELPHELPNDLRLRILGN